MGVLNILSARLTSEVEEKLGPEEKLIELRFEDMENNPGFRRSGVLLDDTAMVLDMASVNHSCSTVLSSVMLVQLLTSSALVFSLSRGLGELGLTLQSDLDFNLICPFSVKIL